MLLQPNLLMFHAALNESNGKTWRVTYKSQRLAQAGCSRRRNHDNEAPHDEGAAKGRQRMEDSGTHN